LDEGLGPVDGSPEQMGLARRRRSEPTDVSRRVARLVRLAQIDCDINRDFNII
jgi:hypothetical protein